ncbi:phosphotransferase [Kitasatospora sp. NPDC056076]|uniref:phosphotransferase n=1 Tax=Kitasatospora sp. NPDC056076 TaxID=3345703 RepID=UPI0035D783C0
MDTTSQRDTRAITTTPTPADLDLLRRICAHTGLDADAAQPIRLAANHLWSAGDVVIRIGRPGLQEVAAKEIAVARWLTANRIRTARPYPGLPQAVAIEDRAVTFWHKIDAQRPGTPAELAAALAQIHALPVPHFLHQHHFNPLDRHLRRLERLTILGPSDHAWISRHLHRLHAAWNAVPAHLSHVPLHGDASTSNLVVDTAGRPHLIDFESSTSGHIGWDLIPLLSSLLTYNDSRRADYDAFTTAYGLDITTLPHWELMLDVYDSKAATWALDIASRNPALAPLALHRLHCLQGHYGLRPWNWEPVR